MKFIRYVEDQIGFRVKLASFGPTANDVREL
jgi:adenylosuccinate synthase